MVRLQAVLRAALTAARDADERGDAVGARRAAEMVLSLQETMSTDMTDMELSINGRDVTALREEQIHWQQQFEQAMARSLQEQSSGVQPVSKKVVAALPEITVQAMIEQHRERHNSSKEKQHSCSKGRHRRNSAFDESELSLTCAICLQEYGKEEGEEWGVSEKTTAAEAKNTKAIVFLPCGAF
jgi:hypothetical protein